VSIPWSLILLTCKALNAANSGDLDLAIHMCEEMRLRPDIDDFRKAMVTLFLAHAVIYDTGNAMKFARETLNILQSLRTGHCGYCEHGISEMEKQANEIILDLEMEKLGLSEQSLPAGDDTQKIGRVSQNIKKEKAIKAVTQMEVVLDPDCEPYYGLQRECDGMNSRAGDSSNSEGIECDKMDCD
jgi:hypothetical protein